MKEEKSATIEKDSKAEKKSGKEKKFDIKAIISNYKGEYKKIIWPKRDELVKSTVIVMITSAVFGVIICGMDWVYSVGYNWFYKFF